MSFLPSFSAKANASAKFNDNEGQDSRLELVNEVLNVSIKIGVMLVIYAIVVVLASIPYKLTKEGYTIARGQYYKPGQAIFGDFPEKVKIGDSEYENPIYKDISTRWEPTSNKANGYTIWKMRD